MQQVQKQSRRRVGRPSASADGAGRDALIRAARALFSERGPGYVTLTATAERAGVNPALVKYHFGSKLELFAAVLTRVLDEWRPKFMALHEREMDDVDRLKAVLELLIDVRSKDPYVDRLMLEQMLLAEDTAARKPFRDYMELALTMNRQLLQKGQDAGKLRDLNPLHVHLMFLGVAEYFGSARGILQEFAGVSFTPAMVEDYKRTVIDVLLNGLLGKR
jgi:TetR/AcrR family transcriptional regulator